MNKFEIKITDCKYEDGIFEEIQIFVDGENLIEKLKEIEKPFAAAENPSPKPGNYLGLKRKFITPEHFLGKKDAFYGEKDNKTALLDCSCGCEGCWTFAARITETQDSILWSDFEQVHRRGELAEIPWEYNALGSLIFEKQQYLEELKKLKV